MERLSVKLSLTRAQTRQISGHRAPWQAQQKIATFAISPNIATFAATKISPPWAWGKAAAFTVQVLLGTDMRAPPHQEAEPLTHKQHTTEQGRLTHTQADHSLTMHAPWCSWAQCRCCTVLPALLPPCGSSASQPAGPWPVHERARASNEGHLSWATHNISTLSAALPRHAAEHATMAYKCRSAFTHRIHTTTRASTQANQKHTSNYEPHTCCSLDSHACCSSRARSRAWWPSSGGVTMLPSGRLAPSRAFSAVDTMEP